MEEDKIEKDEKNEEETKEGVKNMEKEDESKQTDVEEKKQKIEKKNEETYISAETTQSEIKEGTEKETKELEEDDAQEKEIQKNEENKEKVNEIKTNEGEQQSNKEKKSIVPVVIITILICLALFFSIIFALININNENILSGISIMNVDVSKLSKEDALKKINEIVASKETEDITLKSGDYETVINGKQFSIKFDTEKAINEAYNVGKDGNYNYINRAKMSPRESLMAAYDADVFLSSANAITSDGVMVNIDGNSNRVSCIAQGPKKVVFIVGMNKVCSDLDAAMKRARNVAAPANAQRFEVKTPCKTAGKCFDCKSPDTICCQFLITRYSRHVGRIHVILVNDTLGY